MDSISLGCLSCRFIWRRNPVVRRVLLLLGLLFFLSLFFTDDSSVGRRKVRCGLVWGPLCFVRPAWQLVTHCRRQRLCLRSTAVYCCVEYMYLGDVYQLTLSSFTANLTDLRR